jgi:hypothetical protein
MDEFYPNFSEQNSTKLVSQAPDARVILACVTGAAAVETAE